MVKLIKLIILLAALAALFHKQVDAYGVQASASASVAVQPETINEQVFITKEQSDRLFNLERLKESILEKANNDPNLFDPEDVEGFLNDHGVLAAERFLNQRSDNWRRAAGLATSTLTWRKNMGINQLQASDFPCDLFTLGLIFEYGRAHHQISDGHYVEGNPVIWLRVGALGSVVKHLEKLTPARLLSYGYNAPRDALSYVAKAVSRRTRRRRRDHRRKNERLIRNYSVKENHSINHILKAIMWWLNDWVLRNPEYAKATLVLDFEGTDFAFASWSIGEFFVKLDDLFPDLFDQIIGFRYKPKLWSLHSPISMFNRIFKSRVASSPETDRKLKFVSTEPQLSMYMPRVDSKGFTMLPEHVSGTCVGSDDTKAPIGCLQEEAGALFDPTLWRAVHNEFYYSCRPKA